MFQSCGKFRSAAPRRKSPLEVPTEEIANAREEATAARSSLVSIHDDGDGDARTMAESGMEVDSDMDVDEVEPDDAQQDVDENENQDEIAERRPVLVQENTHIIVPVLTQARMSMQVPYYPNSPTAYCIYARLILFAYMAYVVVHCMYKSWVKTMRWTTLQYDQILSNCANGDRYVVLGKWPTLCDIDPGTKVSRDVTDEGLLSYIRGLGDPEAPDGIIPFGNSEPINCSPSSCEVLARWACNESCSTHRPILTAKKNSDASRNACDLLCYNANSCREGHGQDHVRNAQATTYRIT